MPDLPTRNSIAPQSKTSVISPNKMSFSPLCDKVGEGLMEKALAQPMMIDGVLLVKVLGASFLQSLSTRPCNVKITYRQQSLLCQPENGRYHSAILWNH